MPDAAIECSIDHRSWSRSQIAMVEYNRHIHLLHEMKRLGAAIEHDGIPLTHDEINLLNASDARDACVAARQSHGIDGMTHLYQDLLRASDRMWKEVNANDGREAPVQFSTADFTVTGMSFEDLHAALGPENLSRDYALLNPDHYFIEECETGMHAMETFGMYGGPSEVHLIADPTTPIPVESEPGYVTSWPARQASPATAPTSTSSRFTSTNCWRTASP